MKTGKLSPLLVILMLALAGTLAGMTYMFLTQPGAGGNSLALLFSAASIVLVAGIAMVMIGQTRRQLAEQAAQNERNQACLLYTSDAADE